MATPDYTPAQAKSIVDNLITAIDIKKLVANAADTATYNKQIESINQLRTSFGDIATAKILGSASDNATSSTPVGSPRVRQLLQDLQGGTPSPERTALQTALAGKIKTDTSGFIDRLEAQLASNPGLAAEIKDKMINKPAEAQAKLDDLFKPNADISAVLKATTPAPAAAAAPPPPAAASSTGAAVDATFKDLNRVQGFSTFLDKAADNPELNALLGIDALQSTGNAAARNAQLAKDNPVFDQLKQMSAQDPSLFTKINALMGTTEGAANVARAMKDSTTNPAQTKDIVTNLVNNKPWQSPSPAAATQAGANPLDSILTDIGAMKALPGGDDFIKKLQSNAALSDALGLNDILSGKVTDQNRLRVFAGQVSQIRKDAEADPNYFKNLSAALDSAPPQMISQVAATVKEHPETLAEELKKANRMASGQSGGPLGGISDFFNQLGMGDMMGRVMNVIGGLIEKIVGFFEKMLGGVSGGRMNGISSEPNNPVVASVLPGTRMGADGRVTQADATVQTQPGVTARPAAIV